MHGRVLSWVIGGKRQGSIILTIQHGWCYFAKQNIDVHMDASVYISGKRCENQTILFHFELSPLQNKAIK